MAEKINYHIFFLNVGQGNSCLLIKREIDEENEAVNCITMLVDTCIGGEGQVDPVTLVKECLPTYKKNGKEYNLNAMVITHPHNDHIQGLHTFVNELNVERIYHPDYDFLEDKDTDDYKAYNKLRKDSSSQQETRLVAGNDYNKYISFVALSPPQNIDDSQAFKELPEKIQVHTQCGVINIKANDINVLFLGDANQNCIQRLMDYHEDRLPAHILVAPHHCSNSAFVPEDELEENIKDVERGDSNSCWDEEFLEKINPDYIIVSSGDGNSYGHPHKAALETYEDICNVIRTDKKGTVHVLIDENNQVTLNYIKSLTKLNSTVRSLFPSNAPENNSLKSFFITGSQLPVAPRNA